MKRNSSLLNKLLRLTVSVALLARLAYHTDWSQVRSGFVGMRWEYWLAAAGTLIAAQMLSAWRWKYYADRLGLERSLGQLTAFYFIGMFFNLMLPTSVGGNVVRAWYLDKQSGQRLRAFASVLLDRLNGLVVLVALACLAVVLSPLTLPGWIVWSVWGIAAGGVVGIAGLFLIGARGAHRAGAGLLTPPPRRTAGSGDPRRAQRRRGWLSKLAQLRDIATVFGEPRLLPVTLTLSLLVQAGNVLVVWLIGQAIHAPVPAAYYWVMVPMVSLLTLLPISVNGMGVREEATVLFLAPLGVAAGTALTLSVLWFAVSATVSLVGGAVYLFGQVSQTGSAGRRAASGESEVTCGTVGGDSDQGRAGQHRRCMSGCASALDPLRLAYEIVFVDDGSIDGSFAVLEELAARDPHVKVVRLRRNFGQSAALQAGIDWSTGDVIVTMDGDLQNDPADIPLLLAKLGEGYDAVLGLRAKRQDHLFIRKIPSLLGNWLIRKVTGVQIKDLGCTLRAMRRELAEALPLYGEMHRFIPVLAQQAGARLTQIPVRHHPRTAGKTKYNLSRTFRVVLDLITVKFLHSYLTRPMHVMGLAGLCSMGLGVLSLIVTILMKWSLGTFMTGNPLLLLSAMLRSGRRAIHLDGPDRRTDDADVFREPGQEGVCRARDAQHRGARRTPSGVKETLARSVSEESLANASG